LANRDVYYHALMAHPVYFCCRHAAYRHIKWTVSCTGDYALRYTVQTHVRDSVKWLQYSLISFLYHNRSSTKTRTTVPVSFYTTFFSPAECFAC